MKIMIIGNGFDLNLGLKTSYSDFISSDFFKSLVAENNSLAVYLAKQNELNNWVDIEQEITKYSTQVQAQDTEVENDFEALKTALMAYLKEAQEGEINHESKAFQMMRNEIATTDKIYNFNYTNSIFRVAEMLKIDIAVKRKHFYIHGSIENKDIIFGVEDTAKVHKKHKFFKKSHNENFGKSDIMNFLNMNNDLVVFGHSFGITDSSYFADYIHELSIIKNKENPELKFFHYGKQGYKELMAMLDEYTFDNVSKFKTYINLITCDSSKNN
ncbi:hypothetical protein SJPD1_1636 [Sulfurospirillum diekertiae]|uniref:Uncharacterized protein n=1 Tax=Sulfurospirillum diekertiae TaxID=1854492 RepID=A0A290HDV9_9BACT|nr:AbiH family protein [Sulfurospirillum diekertiae]ATB69742.1 hypothetical protein SJPD1_1636 [Sulfurospirillum diekertiae]